jgi:tetratricopeptide (TPR) repeat protein
MTRFVWKGTDPQGNRRTAENNAGNAQEARRLLQFQGWTDLQLIIDELGDTVRELSDGPDDWKNQTKAEDDVRFFEGEGPGFWHQLWKSLWARESKVNILLFSALFAFGVYIHRPWLWIGAAAVLVLLVLLFPALHLYFSQPLQYYERLNKAKVWGRWDEVDLCIRRLRQLTRFTRIGPGEAELVRCEGQLLAARGNLGEGLRHFRKMAFNPKLPEWMYLSFQAGIYDVAKEFDRSLECRQKAAELKPDTSIVWIDLAYGLVRGLNRPAEARRALAEAEKLEVNALGKHYVEFLYGVIAWRENDLFQARRHLEKALPGFQKFAHQPLVEAIILLTKAYLCVVMAGLREMDRARQYWHESEKFLEANKEAELAQACRAAIGAVQA